VDTAIATWLNHQAQRPGLHGLAVIGAKYLVFAPVLIALGLAVRSIWRRDATATASMVVAGVGTLVALALNVVATSLWFRARPYAALSDVQALVAPNAESSFFSDHTIAVTGAAIGALLVSRRWGAIAIAIAALVAVARVGVGAHYPSDVLTAAIITTLAITSLLPARALVAGLVQPLLDRIPQPRPARLTTCRPQSTAAAGTADLVATSEQR
jgi:undecaprenyl-diphosphatase